jgi:hypothetical protein
VPTVGMESNETTEKKGFTKFIADSWLRGVFTPLVKTDIQFICERRKFDLLPNLTKDEQIECIISNVFEAGFKAFLKMISSYIITDIYCKEVQDLFAKHYDNELWKVTKTNDMKSNLWKVIQATNFETVFHLFWDKLHEDFQSEIAYVTRLDDSHYEDMNKYEKINLVNIIEKIILSIESNGLLNLFSFFSTKELLSFAKNSGLEVQSSSLKIVMDCLSQRYFFPLLHLFFSHVSNLFYYLLFCPLTYLILLFYLYSTILYNSIYINYCRTSYTKEVKTKKEIVLTEEKPEIENVILFS